MVQTAVINHKNNSNAHVEDKQHTHCWNCLGID